MKAGSGGARARFWIAIAYAALSLLGLYFVADASYPYADRDLGSPYLFFFRHLVYLAASVCVFFFTLSCRASLWQKLAWLAFGVGLLLCFLVLVPGLGVTVNGAKRWLRAGPITFQPSELLKIGLILALASTIGRKPPSVRRLWPGFTMVSVLILLSAGVCILQKDLGTALVMLMIGGSIVFAAGARLRHIGSLAVLLGLAVAALILIEPYRLERIYAWLQPWKHQMDESYQVVQSYFAFGLGSWHGTGPQQGQAKYFIPAPHTDFVFSTVAEETGFVGPAVISALFVLIAFFGMEVARKSVTPFGRLAATGLVTYLCGQALLNIAVVTGALPCTGVPLPFISYGGSSLIAGALAVGLLCSLSKGAVRTRSEESDEGDGYRRGNRRPHLSGPGSSLGPSAPQPRPRTPVRG